MKTFARRVSAIVRDTLSHAAPGSVSMLFASGALEILSVNGDSPVAGVWVIELRGKNDCGENVAVFRGHEADASEPCIVSEVVETDDTRTMPDDADIAECIADYFDIPQTAARAARPQPAPVESLDARMRRGIPDRNRFAACMLIEAAAMLFDSLDCVRFATVLRDIAGENAPGGSHTGSESADRDTAFALAVRMLSRVDTQN